MPRTTWSSLSPPPAQPKPGGRYQLGDLAIDYDLWEVRLAGHPVELTAMEFDPLRLLTVNAGRVATHEELLQRVWGPANPGSPRTIRTHPMRLRQKLGEDGEYPTSIFSEPRVGYRMIVGETGGGSAGQSIAA